MYLYNIFVCACVGACLSVSPKMPRAAHCSTKAQKQFVGSLMGQTDTQHMVAVTYIIKNIGRRVREGDRERERIE